MPAKLERCVRKVKGRGGVRNPWAVCVESTGIKRKKGKDGGGWTKGKRGRKKKKK